MWNAIIFVSVISLSSAQYEQLAKQTQGNGWDIRLAVPGEPGTDYPTLGNIPRTTFSCAGKGPGYYADLETNCQVFRVCTTGSTYGFQSFLCPNGTLFNQAVFVCDWWMNVNCDKATELFSINTEKFGNLRLGPQLMKDIKKMLTHSMRNPYDKSTMKSNLIVMQDYRAPFGQMLPNGAIFASPERPNSIYSPAKQVQAYSPNYGGTFVASTPSPTYVPPPVFNTITTNGDAEIFQKQRQSGQFAGKLQQHPGNAAPNSHTEQFTQIRNSFNNGNAISRPTQAYNQRQIQYTNQGNGQTQQRGQIRHSSQYTNNRTPQTNSNQREFGVSYSKQQYNYTPNHGYANIAPNTEVQSEVKQNLVSNLNVPATVVTKTLTFNRIQDSKVGNPKSRITFKTWIVKPSKAAKLIAEPTGYNYEKPTQPSFERIIQATPYTYNPVPATQAAKIIQAEQGYAYNPPRSTQAAKIVQADQGYVYNPPRSTQAAKIVQADQVYVYNPPRSTQAAKIVQADQGYVYNPPRSTQAAKIVQANQGYVYNPPRSTQAAKIVQADQGYVYNKPTVAAKQIVQRQPSRQYLTPTLPPPTANRLYLAPKAPPPTLASKLYLAPTTYKPATKLYIPPSQNLIVSRQYLAPSAIQQPAYYQQSDKLQASPTSPAPVYVSPTNENTPSFSLTKQSRINANHNNLTFADILTKEKLDITVNDIVSDTSKFLKTAEPPQLGEYRQDTSVDYPDENYLPPNQDEESDEQLTPQSPTVAPKSARLIANPSRELEPPHENFDHNESNAQINNPIANLPFFKEPGTNTIERTVSLKISIPEKVASYLFKNQSDHDYDKLEILNTGSSNYLVLTNNLLHKNPGANFIPLGRLTANKNSNISDSQALVFSFLADSLNAAKEYSNIAQQNVIPTPQHSYQTVNSEDLTDITNKISQLTASQYTANNHNFNQINAAQISQTSNSNQQKAAKYTDNSQNQPQIHAQINSAPAQINQGHSRQSANLQSPNQIYSGQLYQLPVPDVTNHVYNAGANVIHSAPQHSESDHLLSNHNDLKQSAEVEIVRSQTLPVGAPAKLQFAPSNDESFNSHEHSAQALNFLNNGNGISAQLQDKIVGTIPHPSENKLVTYKKDQSYYVYTKLNNGLVNNNNNNLNQQSAKLVQRPNSPDIITFQLVPSVSYQLDDEKDQQTILNTFHIDEFGSPKKLNQVEGQQDNGLTTDVDYAVEHPTVNTLYAGPSSYSAPQASIGSLIANPQRQSARIQEQPEDTNNGYPRSTPARQFTF